jgi:uncharacterized damage-inducible protein DinB
VFSIRELHAYATRVRRNFFEKMKTLPWDVVTKEREASHHNMRNILLHMVDNEEWIVNWVIRGRPSEYRAKKWDEYADYGSIEAHLDDVESRTLSFLADASEAELARRVKFVLSSGATFDLSVEESIMQSVSEQLFHTGELIALLWQDDIEPPKMQWFWNNPRADGSSGPGLVR